MKKYIKIILNIIICTICLIFFINNSEVEATNLKGKGNSVTIDAYGGSGRSSDLLAGANHVFCIQQGQRLNSGTKYNVKYYAIIDGTKCTIYSGNGTKLLGTTNNATNAKYAYVVSQPDMEVTKKNGVWDVTWVKKRLWSSSNKQYVTVQAHKVNKDGLHGSDMVDDVFSNIQKEVYGSTATWLSANSSHITNIGTNAGGYGTTNWNSQATSYANQIIDASITNNTNMSNITKEFCENNGESYIKIGPFNFTFTGNYSSSTVYNQNNEAITVKYASYNGTRLNVYNTINEASTSGKDFYIMAPADGSVSKINKITATVLQTKTKVTSEIWILQASNKDQNIISTDSKTDTIPTTATVNINNSIDLTGSLTIEKSDSNNSQTKLANVKFILKNEVTGKYIKQVNNLTTYVNKAEATEFTTDSSGKVTISNLLGNYIIYETQNPNTGYGESSFNNPIDIAKATVKSSQINTVQVYNQRKYIKLSGYVWEDKIDPTKQSVANNLLNDNANDVNDKLLQDVIVKLKNNNGNVVQSTTTNIGGSYIFENVLIDDLPNLYIEFTYNGMNYQCVDLINLQKENASKANEGKNRTEFNNSYNTITQGKSNKYNLNYKTENHKSKLILGDNLKYSYSGAEYPINGVYTQYEITSTTLNAYGGNLDKIYTREEIRSKSITEIKNINLGLKVREQPDLSIEKEIHSAKVSIQGEEFIYLYNDESEARYEIDPQVKFGKERGSQTYTRGLYASDIKNLEGNGLQVKITYRLGIKNQATNLKIKVNEIADYFDTKYDKNSVIVGTTLSEDGTTPAGGTVLKGEATNNTEYSKVKINTNITLEPQSTTTIYVQLTVKKQNIINIVDVGEEVKLDNIAEIISYSTLDKNGYVYAGIDTDSQPGNTKPGNIATYEDDTDIAPGLLILLQEERKVEGTVFADQITQDSLDLGSRQGSGTYDEGELGISGIEVVVKTEDGNIAQVYDAANKVWKDAITTTNSKGKYCIGGFIPGKYYIVYDWGGQEYILSNGNSKTITVQDYKGTIVNKQAHTAKATNEEWYKDEFKKVFSGIEWQGNSEIRVSDAVDNYDTRKTIDNQITDITYETKQLEINDTSIIQKMQSKTPEFKINLEYVNSQIDATEEYEKNSDGTLKVDINGYVVKKDGYKNTIKNIDFGIVERPKQTLALKKEVKHIKLVLANGSTLFKAEVENGALVEQVNYITYIPEAEAEANKAQLKMEIDNEIVQGAILEVRYGFTIENKSELDYNTQEYYLYGLGYGEDESNIVTLEAKEIIDYIDNEIAIDMNKNNQWKLLSENDITNNYNGKLLADSSKLEEFDRKITTNILSGEELKPGDTISNLKCVTSKYLANNEETYLENHAEIIHVEKNGGSSLTTTPGNYVPNDAQTVEVDSDSSENVYILPPTGRTDNTISYVILAISTLGILVAGIILIKRFVIK